MNGHIAGNFQVVNNHESEKNHYLKDFTGFFYTNIFFSFSQTNTCLPSRWIKTRAAPLAANHFVGSKTPKGSDFDLITKSFENSNSILNIFQETHNFLI